MPAGQFSKDPVVDKALRHSVRDGMAWSVQVGAGETYFSAFALFLRATAPQIAILSTLPPLLASGAQIFSAWLGNYVGRRRLVLFGCALQALLWLPIIVLPAALGAYAFPALLLLLVLYHSANNLASPQWTSIMRDLVSERRRGRYFAHRTRLMTVATFLGLVTCGLILHELDTAGPHLSRVRRDLPDRVRRTNDLGLSLDVPARGAADDDGARHAHRALVAQPALDGRDRFLGLLRAHERGRRHLVAVLHGVHVARSRRSATSSSPCSRARACSASS